MRIFPDRVPLYFNEWITSTRSSFPPLFLSLIPPAGTSSLLGHSRGRAARATLANAIDVHERSAGPLPQIDDTVSMPWIGRCASMK